MELLRTEGISASGVFLVGNREIRIVDNKQEMGMLFIPAESIPKSLELSNNVSYKGNAKMVSLEVIDSTGKRRKLDLLVAGNIVFFRFDQDSRWTVYSPNVLPLDQYRIELNGRSVQLSNVISIEDRVSPRVRIPGYRQRIYDTLVIKPEFKNSIPVQSLELKDSVILNELRPTKMTSQKTEDPKRSNDNRSDNNRDQVISSTNGIFVVNGTKIRLVKDSHLNSMFSPANTIPPSMVLNDNVKFSGKTTTVSLDVYDSSGRKLELQFLVANNMVLFRFNRDDRWVLYTPEVLSLDNYRIRLNGREVKLSELIDIRDQLQTVGSRKIYDVIFIRPELANHLNSLGKIREYTLESASLNSLISTNVKNEQAKSTVQIEKPGNTDRTPSQKETVQKPKRSPMLEQLYNSINKVDRDNVVTAVESLLNGKYKWIWFGIAKKDLPTVQKWFRENFGDKYVLSILEDRGNRVRVRVDPKQVPQPSKIPPQTTTPKPSSKESTKDTPKVNSSEILPKPSSKESPKALDNIQSNLDSQKQTIPSTNQTEQPQERERGNMLGIEFTRQFSQHYSELLKSRDISKQHLQRAKDMLSRYSERDIYAMLGLNPEQMIRNREMLARTDRNLKRPELTVEQHLAIVLMALDRTGVNRGENLARTVLENPNSLEKTGVNRQENPIVDQKEEQLQKAEQTVELSQGTRRMLAVGNTNVEVYLSGNLLELTLGNQKYYLGLPNSVEELERLREMGLEEAVPVIVISKEGASLHVLDPNRLDELQKLQEDGDVYLVIINVSDRGVTVYTTKLDRIAPVIRSLDDVVSELNTPDWMRDVVHNIDRNPEQIDPKQVPGKLESYYSDEEIRLLNQIYEMYFKSRMSWEEFVGFAIYYFEKPVVDVEVR
ncbi:MAG: hypothetical protein QXO13_02220 [Candidatus Anstonellales archaeon]